MSKIKITFISFVILFIGLTIYYFYPEDKLPKGIKIDKMIVYKSKRKLLAYSNDKLIKTYKIALGRQPIGAKQYQGDRKTPDTPGKAAQSSETKGQEGEARPAIASRCHGACRHKLGQFACTQCAAVPLYTHNDAAAAAFADSSNPWVALHRRQRLRGLEPSGVGALHVGAWPNIHRGFCF